MRSLIWVAPLCAGLGACNATPDPIGLQPGETLLSVTGTGRTEATPGQALFTAGLSSIAADARGASERNARTMTAITQALAKLGVAQRDIQTRNLSVNRITWGANKGQYEVANSVTVRMRDTGKVGAAIAAVTDAGANIVSGPDLSVADAEKANLTGYGNAYKTARAKADAYAAAAGLHIVRVLSIRDGGTGGELPQAGDMTAMPVAPPPVVAMQSAAPPVMAGTNNGVVAARVDFALAPK